MSTFPQISMSKTKLIPFSWSWHISCGHFCYQQHPVSSVTQTLSLELIICFLSALGFPISYYSRSILHCLAIFHSIPTHMHDFHYLLTGLLQWFSKLSFFAFSLFFQSTLNSICMNISRDGFIESCPCFRVNSKLVPFKVSCGLWSDSTCPACFRFWYFVSWTLYFSQISTFLPICLFQLNRLPGMLKFNFPY